MTSLKIEKSVFLTAIAYDSYEVLANIFEKLEQETLETLEAETREAFQPQVFGYRRGVQIWLSTPERVRK